MHFIEWTDELRFLVAIALGFLVGLERESRGGSISARITAGVRTYTLVVYLDSAVHGFTD